MNQDEALAFLANNQPLPPDRETDERIILFAQALKIFKQCSDPRCVGLILNAFGEGSGFGVYQIAEDTILQYPSNLVVPEISKALRSSYRSVRYWNAQIAASFPDEALVDDLANLLEEDDDMRFAAYVALSQIHSAKVVSIFKKSIANEKDETIREILREYLDGN